METHSIEYKSNFNDSVIETLVAFSNSKGGVVWVGRNDKGESANGFNLGKESIQNWLNEIKQKTNPPIIPDVEILQLKGGECVGLRVSEFPIKPVAFKGRYLKRVGNANHQLSIHEISDMYLKTFNGSWDNHLSLKYEIQHISLNKIHNCIEQINSIRENPIKDTPIEFLRKYDLIRENKVTNACFLLFGKDLMSTTTIQIGRFASPTVIKDSIIINASLVEQIHPIMEFIKKHINKSYIISGDAQRIEKWQYPITAIREVVINMIVHRNYQEGSDSIIKIYDDLIEFFNPGCLSGTITVEQLLSGNYVSFARNKKIAELFRELGWVEKYGSGISRVVESLKVEGLGLPSFANVQHGFKVVLYSKPQNVVDNVVDNVVEKVVENKNRILSIIKENGSLSAKRMGTLIGLNERTVQRILAELKQQNLIRREGAAKGGKWIIN